jgi:2-polyprenyl-3-methyl-5-hydroxy-6-metoxy-1,4-benzoquinol methylase
MSCKDFLFETNNSEFKYIGNKKKFDNIYSKLKDPWDQSNNNDKYYHYSRIKINNLIKDISKKFNKINILEIGCGNGFTTNEIYNITDKEASIYGCDISTKAIKNASKNYPKINFFYTDITEIDFNKIEKKYDLIIISNLLWYIMEKLKLSFNNCFNLLNTNGYLLFYQAFLKEQKYGKEIINGFNGMKQFLKREFSEKKILLEINDINESYDNRYFGLFLINNIN